MNDITFETKIDFGNFCGNKKLTFTSWNGNAPRYDVRDWYDDGKCGKGITFDKDELKALYQLMIPMFEEDRYKDADFDGGTYITTEEVVDETTEDTVEDTTEDTSLASDVPFGLTEEEKDDDVLFMNIEEPKYPAEIQQKFKVLEEMFSGFKTEKMYGKMPFADGDRLQFCVTKNDKPFDVKENDLKELGVKWFITDKGNLYIYTL